MMQGLETLTSSFGGLIVLKSTILLLVALLASVVCRKTSAATRHYFWTLTFVALLALPFAARASFLGSAWQIRLPILRPTPAVASPTSAARRTWSPSSERPRSTSASSPPSKTISWWQALWLAGSVLLVVRLSVGLLASYRTNKRALALMDDGWLELLERARETMLIRRPVHLALAPASPMPITLGLWKPTILLPESSETYPVARRSVVLLHELAHVRRHDCLTQLMCHTACAIFWWHPLVWIGAREMRTLSERASDDLVLETGTHAAEYAHDLLDMARGLNVRASAAPLASVTMAHPSRLEERLLAILDDGMNRGPLRAHHVLPTALASFAVLLSVALAAPTAASLSVIQADATEPEPTSQETDANRRARAALAEALDDADASVREQALRALVRIGDASVIPYLEETLRSGTADMRDEAAWALGQMRYEEAADGLIAALSDESDGVREQAAWALGMIRSGTATDALVQALGDETANVRSHAAWACGMIRSSAAVDALIAALSDQDEDVRSEVAWALGMIRDGRALDGLAGALGDASVDVREEAIWAIGMMGSPASFDVLVAALRDSSPDIRSEAAWALGMLRDARAVDALSDALKDEDADVREQAAWAIGHIAGDGDDDIELENELELELEDLESGLDEDIPSQPNPRGAIL